MGMWNKLGPTGGPKNNSLMELFEETFAVDPKKPTLPEGLGTLPMNMVYDARCEMSPRQPLSDLEEEVFEYERIRLVIRLDVNEMVPSYCYMHHRRVAASMKLGDFLAHRLNGLGISLDTVWVFIGTGEVIPPRDKRLQSFTVGQVRRT